MKRNSLWTLVLAMFLIAWLSLPTVASAEGPSGQWSWQLLQQTVKVINGKAYPPGSQYPLHYSAVVQQLRHQGWVESGWSSVGGTRVIYYYFTKVVATITPAAPFFGLLPNVLPSMFLQQVNPLHFPPRMT